MSVEDQTKLVPLIQVSNLGLVRDYRSIFSSLSFSVRVGEVVVIEGSNGSGKTSLLRIIAGLLDADEGECLWRGQAWSSEHARVPGSIAMLGHSLGLKLDLTVRENIEFRMAFGRKPLSIDWADALGQVGLDGYEDVMVRFLSAGQRRRVTLAALSLVQADLWILDEPYANLDQQGHALLDRMLDAHCQNGGAALLSSHGLLTPQLPCVRRICIEAQ
jgi:heme exporter protein A